jgi:hypothetical protein
MISTIILIECLNFEAEDIGVIMWTIDIIWYKNDIKDHTKLASDYQNLKPILGLGKYQSLMVILFTRLVNIKMW